MLNIPTSIAIQLKDKQNILIAGIGGGFDIFAGIPLYYTLKKLGKEAHLANYSFTDFSSIRNYSQPYTLTSDVLGANSEITSPSGYYPEGYLSQWFKMELGIDKTVWMFNKTSVPQLKAGYQKLIDHLKIDAIILVDGGVDSLSRGDEEGSGTMLEDTISLAAVRDLDVPTKILACIGFGTEVEEKVCHFNILENIANLSRQGGFYGSCSLVSYMNSYAMYRDACQYVFNQPGHKKSHISTRVIPAAEGAFGNYHMYPEEAQAEILVSPFMSMFWFFDANAVIFNNGIIPHVEAQESFYECVQQAVPVIKHNNTRARKLLPY